MVETPAGSPGVAQRRAGARVAAFLRGDLQLLRAGGSLARGVPPPPPGGPPPGPGRRPPPPPARP